MKLDVVRLVPMLGGGLRVGNREYPGIIEVVGQPDGMIVVNELPLEEYLAGVVKAEAGDRVPLEMLKAQAIVARTYAAYHRELYAGRLYHLASSTAHQQYGGRVAQESPAWTAVRETYGQVMRWEGELFPAFYHTDSGGHTEDPRVVFGTAGIPALPAVPVGLHATSPHQEWRLDLPLAQSTPRVRAASNPPITQSTRCKKSSPRIKPSRLSVLSPMFPRTRPSRSDRTREGGTPREDQGGPQ